MDKTALWVRPGQQGEPGKIAWFYIPGFRQGRDGLQGRDGNIRDQKGIHPRHLGRDPPAMRGENGPKRSPERAQPASTGPDLNLVIHRRAAGYCSCNADQNLFTNRHVFLASFRVSFLTAKRNRRFYAAALLFCPRALVSSALISTGFPSGAV